MKSQRSDVSQFGLPAGGITLGARFCAISSQYPDHAALAWPGGRLTYAEVERRSAALSGSLQALGVQPGDRVGLHLSRSPELMLAILAVVRAGAVYVPLDPTYPTERLRWMAQDACLTLLLTGKGSPGLAPAPCPVRQVTDLPAGRADDAKVTSSAPVYVMYTSGSTGDPKGVVVPQRGVIRLVCDVDYVRLDRDTRVLQLAPTSFDASTFEIWGPWLNGGTLVLAPPEMPDLGALGRLIAEQRIDTMWLTGSLFNLVADEAVQILQPLSQVLTGGEALSLPHARRALAALPHITLINGYGPTENTTFTTCYTVPPDIDESLPYSPLGYPIRGTVVRVLSEALRPLAPGEVGELCLGGDGVALGYLNRPELTAEVFISDPERPGESLYRSGDLGCLRPDGSLEFHGRRDQQVKIRGYRIEPGEVEAALIQLDGVRQAVVLPHPGSEGETALVAFVVAAGGAVDLAHLRERLGERLPAWMIPTRFVALDALPLNPNGKADRQQLQALARARSVPARRERAPADAVEAHVLDVYRDVLKDPECQPGDRFVDLGGQSIQALRIASRLEREADRRIPLCWVYDHGSPAALAAALRETPPNPTLAATASPGIEPAPGVSFPQERVWFLQQRYPDCRAYHFQATFEFTGPLDVPALERALSELVRRHAILRAGFPLGRGRPEMVPGEAAPIALAPVKVDDVPAFIAAEFLAPMDIARGPLIRWRLLRLAANRHLLVQTEHHLVHDGWSFNLLMEEMQELYRAHREGRPSSLPPAPDFAVVMSDCRARYERRREEDEHWWRQHLAGCTPSIHLPWDRTPPTQESFAGHTVRLSLPRRLIDAHQEMARAFGTTPFVTLLSAFLLLLYRHSGDRELCIGSAVANRADPEVQRLPGMLVNTLLLRFDLGGNPTVVALTKRVHDVIVQASDHQGMPFDRVVALLRREGGVQEWSSPEIMFSMHSSPSPRIDWPGLGVRITEGLSSGTAKSPLNVVLLPTHPDPEIPDGPDTPAMTLIWEYGTARFEEARMQAWREEYVDLVGQLPRRLFSPITDLVGASQRAPETVSRKATVCGKTMPATAQDARSEYIRAELAGIWGEWFAGSIGPEDHFFDVGGHSLLAVRLMVRIRETFGVDVPLATLFEHPTISGMTAAIARSESAGTAGLWRNVAPGPDVRSLWVVPGGYAREVHWHVFAALAQTLGRKRPVQALYPTHSRRRRDVTTIAAEAADTLRALQPRGPYDIVGSCIGGVVAFEVARHLTARGCIVRRLVLLDSVYPAREGGSRFRQYARSFTLARGLLHRLRPVGQRLLAVIMRLQGVGAPVARQRLELARQWNPPRYSERYLVELARHRLRHWDGVIDFVVSETLCERHPERAWEPYAAAIRVHRAVGDHVTYLGSRIRDNQELFRSLLELSASD